MYGIDLEISLYNMEYNEVSNLNNSEFEKLFNKLYKNNLTTLKNLNCPNRGKYYYKNGQVYCSIHGKNNNYISDKNYSKFFKHYHGKYTFWIFLNEELKNIYKIF